MDEASAPLRSGWLSKRGHVRKNWKRRWFLLLSDGSLNYSESEGRLTKGSLNVGSGSCVALPSANFKREHVFAVTSTHGETLVMQADSDHDRDAWVA